MDSNNTFTTQDMSMFGSSAGNDPRIPHDPYQIMMDRKNRGEDTQMPLIQKYDAADEKMVEEFCKKHGIVGFNIGKMPPAVALKILKEKLGIVDEQTPKSYEKQVLHG